MSEATADIGAVMAEYASAVLAKSPARLAALYAPEVRVFDAWDVWVFEGLDAWSRNLRDWLGSLGDEGVRVEFDEVRIIRLGGAASMSAIVTYAAVDARGRVVRSMQNRLSWFLTEAAGRWTIAHEHSSAPIGFQDQKAILQRR